MPPSAPLSYTAITLPTFTATLSRYPTYLPPSLNDLDTQRYISIPTHLKTRTPAHLTKPELLTLITWKLKHGTFRPTLLALAQRNDGGVVEETTRRAFALHAEGRLREALKCLTGLTGVGPATASLLLSVHEPDATPFFADELFRWVMWGEAAAGKGGGWGRRIKYTVGEWEEMVRRVGEVRGRLGVGATEVERVAWVLGGKGVNLGEGEGVGVESKVEGKGKGKGEEETAKRGVKRKSPTHSANPDFPAEGPRRSTRKRKRAAT